jgi:putative ABC transport system ATP-binding protein
MALIDELNAEGATIVVITHEHEIASRCPRQISLLDGRVVSDRRQGEAA